VVVGLALYLMLSRSGPLGALTLLFTPGAMVLAQAVLATPIITALVHRAIEDRMALEALGNAIEAPGKLILSPMTRERHHGRLRDGLEPVRRRSRLDPLALRGRLGSGLVRSIVDACYRTVA
jgi:hypothetical protein